MSESLTIDPLDGPEQRRGRMERSERSMSDVVIDPVVIDEGAPLTPENAAADTAKLLREAENRTAAAEQRATEARTREQEAMRVAQLANAGRAQDRTAAVASAVEAASSDAERAESAYVAARENGDAVAEAKALREMSGAEFRLNQAKGELETLKAQPTVIREPAQPQGGEIGPESRKWINDHPRFNTDNAYKQAALAAHAEALTDGILAESPAYFRHINSRMEQFEGQGRQMDRRQEPRREQFSGAPPSRGNGRGASASNTVQTLLGPVTVNRRADGVMGIQIPPHLRADFEDGARITGMTLADYAHQQVQIADERRDGGNGGLIETESQTYR